MASSRLSGAVSFLNLTKNRPAQLAAFPLVTALLLCVGLTTKSGVGFCFVALVPLAIVIVAPKVPRSTYASAYLAGLAIHLVGMAWVLECYRYENMVGPYLVQWFWIGTWGGVLLVGLLATGRFIYQRQPMPMAVLMPVLWVTYEFIRHEMADIATGTGFPWLKLGTGTADYRYLVQVADLGGEYLLSFLVAMVAGSIVDFIRLFTNKKNRGPRIVAAWAVAGSMILLLAANGYGIWRISQSSGEPGPTVGLLGELELPPIIDSKRLQFFFGGDAERPRHADLLLWPELAYHHTIVDTLANGTSGVARKKKRISTIGLFRQNGVNHARRYLEQTSKEIGTTVVIGCERKQVTGTKVITYNSMACADPLEGYQGCYDKVNLVPGAESSMRSAGEFNRDEFEYGRGDCYRVFNVPTKGASYRFATAICYDLCFGQHFLHPSASDQGERPDFLVQIGAEGQDSSDVLATRMLRYARLRAIESRRSLVRNVTFGYSALIDSNGDTRTVLPTTPISTPTWLGAVPIDDRYSFYAFHGDWVAYSSCLALVALAVINPRFSLA